MMKNRHETSDEAEETVVKKGIEKRKRESVMYEQHDNNAKGGGRTP